jgi:hypothetical protein
MKKVLLIVAVVAIAVLASVAVWKLSDGNRSEGALIGRSNTLTSPNGAFTLSVDDTGIVMKGQGSSVELTPARVQISAPTVSIQGAAAISLQGGIVNLGCSGGGRPVARVGDMASGAPGGNTILPPGSPTVLAC